MNEINIQIFNNGKNKLPLYAKPFDAGFDIRADLSRINSDSDLLGNSHYKFYVDEDGVKSIDLYSSGGRVLVPSGLHMAIPEGYELQVRPRSGLALKHGITMANSPGTIDTTYRGDIGMIVLNTDPKITFTIKDGERIAQGVLCKVYKTVWDSVSDVDALGETERGASGFGDSGVK